MFAVKLTGGKSSNTTLSGTLQVTMRSSSTVFLAVCSGLGRAEASLACRELGFTNVSLLKDHYASSQYSYAVSCQGQEQSLTNCTKSYRRCRYQASLFCYNATADAGV